MSLLQPSRRLCKRWLLRTAQLMSRSRGSRWGWGRKARLLTIHRDGERRSFSSPNSIDREADVAPPPPNLAEISPSQPPGARQSPALISDRFLPAWKGLFLSCFLSSMATLLPPSYKVLIHTSGAGASSRGVPGTVPRARGAPGPWQMPPSRGASCRTGAALGEERCWPRRCWGGREEHPWSPTQASSSSSPSAGAGHGAHGPLGWIQLWRPWGELGGGGGDGWDVHVLFPAPTTLWRQALARGAIPGGIPPKGRVPTASPAGAAAWGRCPSLVGRRRAWQGGGHTGPICFQLQERVRHGSEAAFPLAKIDLKRDKPSPAPGQPAGIFLS